MNQRTIIEVVAENVEQMVEVTWLTKQASDARTKDQIRVAMWRSQFSFAMTHFSPEQKRYFLSHPAGPFMPPNDELK